MWPSLAFGPLLAALLHALFPSFCSSGSLRLLVFCTDPHGGLPVSLQQTALEAARRRRGVAVLIALGLAIGAAFTGRLKLYTAVLERATTRKYQALLVCSKKRL